jgi:hypothetical protein
VAGDEEEQPARPAPSPDFCARPAYPRGSPHEPLIPLLAAPLVRALLLLAKLLILLVPERGFEPPTY